MIKGAGVGLTTLLLPGDLLHHIEDYVTVVQSMRAKFKNFRKTAQLWKLFCF